MTPFYSESEVLQGVTSINKSELLDRFARDGESRVLLARVLDQCSRADSRGIPTSTGFLSPAEQAMTADLLMTAYPGKGLLYGGYADAERKLWAFLPDWFEQDLWQDSEDCPLCALSVSVAAPAGLTHRDYLGSLMGLGIVREKLGDILLSPQGAEILVLRETLPILLSQWEKVGRQPVTLSEIPLSALTPTPGETKQIRTTVASLRLDTVLAAAFSIPRSRAVTLIGSGRVMVNHRLCEKADKPVTERAVLTCRGLGKCVLSAVGGTSKKGRIILELEQYV